LPNVQHRDAGEIGMRLIPLANTLSKIIEPQAVEAIRSLTSELAPDIVEAMVAQRVSLWGCVPDHQKALIVDTLHPYISYLTSITDSDVRSWVLRARPDYATILSHPDGLAWLKEFLTSLQAHVISGDGHR